MEAEEQLEERLVAAVGGCLWLGGKHLRQAGAANVSAISARRGVALPGPAARREAVDVRVLAVELAPREGRDHVGEGGRNLLGWGLKGVFEHVFH